MIEQIHREYGARGLAIVAVDMEESREKVLRWTKDKDVSFPIVLDRSGSVMRAYQITATPAVFVVGRDGKMVAKAVGTKDWTGPRGRAFLEALLAR
jgi:alkyl hydroperoxide reductase subunit AhpC